MCNKFSIVLAVSPLLPILSVLAFDYRITVETEEAAELIASTGTN